MDVFAEQTRTRTMFGAAASWAGDPMMILTLGYIFGRVEMWIGSTRAYGPLIIFVHDDRIMHYIAVGPAQSWSPVGRP